MIIEEFDGKLQLLLTQEPDVKAKELFKKTSFGKSTLTNPLVGTKLSLVKLNVYVTLLIKFILLLI